MKHYQSVNTTCPYNHAEDKQAIYCEGVSEGSVIRLTFASPTEAKDYKKRHCKSDYNTCIVKAMLDRRYGL